MRGEMWVEARDPLFTIAFGIARFALRLTTIIWKRRTSERRS